MCSLFLPDFSSQFRKFAEDENQLNYCTWSFKVNWPLSSSSDPLLLSLSCFNFSASIKHLSPHPPTLLFYWSNSQSLSIIPYMNLPSNPTFLPTVGLLCSGSGGAHITISSPAFPFLFLPCSMSPSLTYPFPVFACPSWDSITQWTSFSETKGSRSLSLHTHTPLLLPFNPSQWGSPRDSDYNQVTAASAMLINVGGLKTEQGERGKKCPCPHLRPLPY